MVKILKKVGRFWGECEIFVGRSPLNISAPAIIFFPVTLCRFNCGFAGLMTVKLHGKTSAPTCDLTLAGLFEKIKDFNLKKILTGKLAAGDFLNGLESLKAMEESIQKLKQEDAQEFFFFQQAKITLINLIPWNWKLSTAGSFSSKIFSGFWKKIF